MSRSGKGPPLFLAAMDADFIESNMSALLIVDQR
jgi:hypothetical protein